MKINVTTIANVLFKPTKGKNAMIKKIVLAMACAVACSSSAFAQAVSGSFSNPLTTVQGGATASGPSISGKVTTEVTAKDVTASAKGENSIARNVLGSVTDGNATEFNSKVNVGEVKAEADGNGACAENVIGSMGSASCKK